MPKERSGAKRPSQIKAKRRRPRPKEPAAKEGRQTAARPGMREAGPYDRRDRRPA